jgi:hypothetical protein
VIKVSRALEWLGKVLPSLEYLVLLASAHVIKEGQSQHYHRTKKKGLYFQFLGNHKHFIIFVTNSQWQFSM